MDTPSARRVGAKHGRVFPGRPTRRAYWPDFAYPASGADEGSIMQSCFREPVPLGPPSRVRRHSGRQASDRSPYRFAGTQNSRGRHGVLRPLEGQPWLRTGPGSAALHLVHHDQYRAALHRCLPVAEDGEKHPQHQDASGDEQDVAGQLEKADGGSDLRAPGRADQQDGADAGRRAEKRQEE